MLFCSSGPICVKGLSGSGGEACGWLCWARRVDAWGAWALYAGSPIYVAEEVMDRAGEEIPGDMEVAARGAGLKEVLKAGVPAESREEREARQSRSAEERREESRQKLLAYLTGAGELGQREAGADA